MSDTPSAQDEWALAADIGGTFTDVVLARASGRVWVAKTLTTPDDPADGLIAGVEQVLAASNADPGAIGRVVHGTTLATNVILERRGVPVAYVTTEGFGSMLVLGRQARVEEERYDLFFEASEPSVPRTRIFEVTERMLASGQVLVPLDEDSVREAALRIAGLDVAAVAICQPRARGARRGVAARDASRLDHRRGVVGDLAGDPRVRACDDHRHVGVRRTGDEHVPARVARPARGHRDHRAGARDGVERRRDVG